MKKQDLKFGNVVELRNGGKFIYIFTTEILQGRKRNFISLKDGFSWITSNYYNDDLTLNENDKEFDIVKVYEDYTCNKVLWERKPILTEDEKVILRNLQKKFKYIARDKYGNLWVYTHPVEKYKITWCVPNEYIDADMVEITVFDNLFQFIKWSDEEAYSIEELLNE